jgi:S-adenosylmethionine-dependent methyltransferase
VFHDYVSEQRGGHAVDQSVIAMELKYSLLEPYKWLGRYIHLLISAKD